MIFILHVAYFSKRTSYNIPSKVLQGWFSPSINSAPQCTRHTSYLKLTISNFNCYTQLLTLFKSLYQSNQHNIFLVLFLAAADMLNASVLIPMYISLKFRENYFCMGLTTCYWWIIGDSITTLASLLSLYFISIDRFVTFPFFKNI